MKKLPQKNFTAEMATSWNGGLLCRRLWMSRSPYLKDIVLEDSPLKEVTYATLFTYMYRRFGIPPLGGDDYKDLCGGWMLKTPSPSLLVMVTPSLSGPYFSFHPFYLQPTQKGKLARDIDDLQLSNETIAELKAAYQALLLDLLRPVCVRDSFFNAVGEVEDDSSLMRSNKDGEMVYQVRYHKSAGFGVPSDLVGCDSYPALCSLLVKAGKGDVAEGSRAVVTLMREPVLKEAASAILPVKRLIVRAVWGRDAEILKGLGFSAKEKARVLRDCVLLGACGWKEITNRNQAKKIDKILEETTDDVVAVACDFLERLGFMSDELSKDVNRALENRTATFAWNGLDESRDADFLIETFKDMGNCDAVRLPNLIRSKFKAAGRPDLVDWLDRTVARRRGDVVLKLIVHSFIVRQQLQQLEDAKV